MRISNLPSMKQCRYSYFMIQTNLRHHTASRCWEQVGATHAWLVLGCRIQRCCNAKSRLVSMSAYQTGISASWSCVAWPLHPSCREKTTRVPFSRCFHLLEKQEGKRQVQASGSPAEAMQHPSSIPVCQVASKGLPSGSVPGFGKTS